MLRAIARATVVTTRMGKNPNIKLLVWHQGPNTIAQCLYIDMKDQLRYAPQQLIILATLKFAHNTRTGKTMSKNQISLSYKELNSYNRDY